MRWKGQVFQIKGACKGPGAGRSMASWIDWEKACVGALRMRGSYCEVGRSQSMLGLEGWYSFGFCPESNGRSWTKGTMWLNLHLKRSPDRLIIANNDDMMMMINACICIVKGLFKVFSHPPFQSQLLESINKSCQAWGYSVLLLRGSCFLNPKSEHMGW